MPEKFMPEKYQQSVERRVWHIQKFWEIHGKGKRVALDIRKDTGEVVARYTESSAGIIGAGTPPCCMTGRWMRVMESDGKIITHGRDA